MTLSKRILVVDGDAKLRQTLQRQYGQRYEMETTGSAEEARAALARSEIPFAVVVCEYPMPDEDGMRFLASIRKEHPTTILVIMTGRPDTLLAMEAVNQGSIFRFLTKPTTTQTFCRGLDDALRQHELLLSEDKFRDETLRGCVEVLADILALTNPIAYGRSRRMRSLVRRVMTSMELPDTWACETAAVLMQIGWVGLPPVLLAKRDAGITLAAEEQKAIDDVPDKAAALLRKIPRFDTIARLVRAAQKPGLARTDTEKTLARILAICSDLDQRLARGIELEQALTQTLRAAGDLSQALTAGFQSIQNLETLDASFTIAISSAKSGWILAQDVVTTDGTKLLGSGKQLSGSALVRLRTYVTQGRVEDFIQVKPPPSQGQAA